MPVRPRLAALSLIPLLLGTSALAAPVTQEGADKLARLAEQQLTKPANPHKDGSLRLTLNGHASATREGDHYRLSLPGAQLHLGDDSVLDLGTLVLAVTPTADGHWDATGALPSPMGVFDGQGMRIGEVRLGSQSLHARWTPDFQTVDLLDAKAGDIRFIPRPGHGAVSMDALAVRFMPEDEARGRWSGPLRMEVNKLDTRTPEGAEETRLLRGLLAIDVTDFNMAQGALLRVGGGTDPGPAGAVLSRMKGTLSLDGYASHDDEGHPYSLKTLNATVTADNMDGDHGVLSLDYSHRGLVKPAVNGQADPIPEKGDLHLKITDLPARTLAEADWNTLPPDAKHRNRAIKDRTLTALGQAGSHLTIDKLDFQAPDAALVGNAALVFDAANPRGLTGTLSLLMRGLDHLPANGVGNGAMLGFFALQSMGAPESQSRRFSLDFRPDGHVKLNGSDVTLLMTGLAKLP
ncbi:hypothetical protein [Nitrospirillum viridazoti]|uniref:DUF2125 domain-containing protein n=1 Tax=Nitrospirillum viridazoti CBAmc TaxID=1441467 RepID=A0A248JSL7_9PROT|nr:hypothetical protein [Nitrospirillum amazonense]ASG21481.1 hypothetical protein Y958_12135 [Nitrospirillum amazonense CBAmc]TWB42397.1 hypothetical protein FBZ91_103419 [Nitrospirillum amazonense]